MWFNEWNHRGAVLQWDIKQFIHTDKQTVVEGYFRNKMNNGTVEAFDGVTIVRWDNKGRIIFLQEFGCNENRYDPYQNGQHHILMMKKLCSFRKSESIEYVSCFFEKSVTHH